MTPRLSDRFSLFGLVFFFFGLVLFVLKSLLGIARQRSRKKIAFLTLKPRSHVRILIYQTWAIRGCAGRCVELQYGSAILVISQTDPYGKAMKK